MPDNLGPSAEHAWNHLRVHTEWAKGFWIAWLFTGYLRLVHEYKKRMQALLSERGAFQIVLRPSTPEEARSLLEEILAEKTRDAGCVWVEILVADMAGDTPGPWTEAWDWLMMRANERRGALSSHLSGGLIFAGAPPFKGRTAAAAPDLWSIRSLMLEPALPIERFDALLATVGPEDSKYAPDVDLALAQADRMRAQGHYLAEAAMRMRAAWGFQIRGKYTEAIEQASKVLEATGEHDDVRSKALEFVAFAEIARGNPAAGGAHLAHLLESSASLHDYDYPILLGILEIAAVFCRDVGLMDEARALEEKLTALSRLNQSPSST
jgi:hypothetical protein